MELIKMVQLKTKESIIVGSKRKAVHKKPVKVVRKYKKKIKVILPVDGSESPAENDQKCHVLA